ncbi:MAG: hypothetical protein NTW11_03945 [Candidatus Staskawiczbacteria bacterium]|nr:hypothetical protein [Candidatus Staskawiczbacteria bacterium]
MDSGKHFPKAGEQRLSEKILLHLADCVEFGFSYRAEKIFGISGKSIRALARAGRKDFKDGITELKKHKFIEKKKNYDGSIIISLTDKGKLRALNIRFKRLNNKKGVWDGRWRMVAFDIPDECKKGRNALRYRARMAGFYELQESLFIYPYDCEKEIKDFVSLFKLEKYVRFALLEFIDNGDYLKKHFKLD